MICSAVLRAVLLLPLLFYIGSAVVFVARQSGGADSDALRLLVAGTGSLLIYFYTGWLIASAFHLSFRQRLLGAAALPTVLFLTLAAMDLVDGGPHHSSGFISLDFNWKTFWIIPGTFLSRPIQNVATASRATAPDAVPPPAIIHVRAALLQPDRSVVLAGNVWRRGVSIDWRLLARLDAAGNLDPSFAPQAPALPDLDVIRPQPDGSALISWRGQDSAIVVGSLSARGGVTTLFEVSPATSNVYPNDNERITDAARDAQGRILLAGRFERKPPPDSAFARINYRVARFHAGGGLDGKFSLIEVPRFFSEDIRMLLAPDGGILLAYVSTDEGGPRLRRLLPDGRADTTFESGLARTIEELRHGPVRAVAVDRQGRTLVVLQHDAPADGLLVRLGADGHPVSKEPAAIPGSLGETGGVVSHPDGSVFVIVGSRQSPVLLRFDADLRPDEPFNARVATLGRDFEEMRILEARDDGGLWLSLYDSRRGTHLLVLTRDGVVAKDVPL